MVSESVHPSPLTAADEGFDTAFVARRFPAAVAVVDGCTGHGIGVNRSAAVLFDDQASLAGLAISLGGHGLLGVKREGGDCLAQQM